MDADRVAWWPPMMTTRERLRLSEAFSRLGNGAGLEVLAAHVPLIDRSWMLTTYGKGAFELAVREAGLAGTRMIVPAFIAHDFVGVFQKYDITPLFVDVDPLTYEMTVDGIDPEVLSSAASLVLLHTFGLPADGKGFRALCDGHGLVLIEDCARALGGRMDGELVGSHGDYAVFSLAKVAPVRRGGLLVARRDLDIMLPTGRAGLSGFLNSMLLLKMPGFKLVEGPLYRIFKETPVYRVEVGLYEPPDLEAPEPLVEFFLGAFMPHYGEALSAKRACALEIRQRLEPLGFRFQADPGNHIYTALGAVVPDGVDSGDLKSHLRSHAINTYTLWGDPLGTSKLAADAWGTDPSQFPVTSNLATRLIHFPVGRFMGEAEIDRLVTACREYLTGRRVAP